MAVNDGTSTELFPGWSSVVHQPCEEPEESELPSTVDMAAFTTGLSSVETNAASQNTTHSDSDSDSDVDSSNSGSDISQSCSQSDSSDSDSSSSSPGTSSRSQSPEFSVTSSQTNALRFKITAVRKSTDEKPGKLSDSNNTTSTKGNLNSKSASSSSESPCSTESESDTDLSRKSAPVPSSTVVTRNSAIAVAKNSVIVKSAKESTSASSTSARKVVSKTRTKVPDKKVVKKEHAAKSKSRLRPRRTRKMASLPLSRGSTYSSSDSDESEADSVMLASCSLQEIRQEDLAAILPDQQECDAFGDFECDRTDKNSPQTGDMSGSDMELPQQAVNALIQRTTESSSESESHPPPNPNSLYANSLLQQFVAQTQMLNAPCPNISQFGGSGGDGAKLSTSAVSGAATENDKSELEPKRRRRGRPKKNESSKEKTEYCTNPNVSPDSGIQNSPDHISSPEPPNMKNQKPVKDKSNKNVKKCDKIKENHPVINKSLSSLNKIICANTDRVLYPPRRKVGRPPTSTRKGPGRPPKAKPEASKDKSSQSKPAKSNRPVLVAKNTLAKNKIVAIRNAKLMHTKNKHKHKKHKKYKFKTLKQPTNVIDPKITIDIEKLIADFMKQCVIGSIKVSKPKENLPEILKTLKKVSKKRKTTEEKKKKKQSVNTTETKPNSNDQRLPLKKRHYHISVNESNQICEEEKPSKVETKPKQSMTQSSNNQKQEHTLQTNINNNEYEGSKDHIDEAIEACINRFTDEAKTVKEAVEIKEEKLNSSNGSITATTPKKRHRLEMTAEKVVPTLKLESPADDNDDKSSAKITVESYITELKIKRNLLTKPTDDIKSESGALDLPPETQQSVKVVPELTKKKVRKRRAINRTGFPTVKRKKKKIPPPVAPIAPIIEPEVCDRVPKDGEEYTDFLERNEHVEDCGMKFDTSRTDPSKWDSISDCESLPLDERIDFELDDLKPDKMTLRQRDSSPATSVDTKSSVCKFDDADLDEISLESSIERLRSRLEKKRKRALEKSLENLNGYPKRRLRDVSPASSIEPIMERRLRDERASASGDEMKKSKKVPRWRKKYLLAGLFSDYFKEDDEATRLRRTENAVKSRLNYVPAEHPYGLLPPPYHCGKYLRNRKLAFHLPYDLWWQHTHSQLPGRDIVPSWNYRKIRTNVYNVKISTGACEPQSCNCKATQNCGDDCINRLVLSECPASHRCQNQKIQRHEWSPGLEKFMTEAKGWGVRTKLPIKSSDFILEYVGEVVSDQEFKERMGTIYGNDNHHYCLHLDGGLVIDGHRMGGDGRFVNHSCQPNCEMQKWSVNGQFRMALFALRDIEGGEELTYDYNFSLFNAAEGQECKCGSEMCRGVIGGKSQRVRQLPAVENAVNKHPGRVGRPRKTEAKKKASNNKESAAQQSVPSLVNIQVKPMSHQQKCFILEHHCFLLRNLTKVRKVRDRSVSTSRQQTATPTDHSSNFMNHLNALQKPRNMKTRRLAQAEDDPELNKTLKIASVLKEIMLIIMSAKDEKDDELLSTNFTTVPSKRKVPDYYTCITDPIDLSTIEQNIATGIYKTPNQFDSDMNRVFNNYIRFYGRSSDIGVNATKLKKIYMESKHKNLSKFENVLGEKPPPNFVFDKKKNEEEDIIRCICGIPRDEGLMIQCERCMVWQHCECVKADESAPSYHCEICIPRKVDYEIPMDEFTEHGHQYYMTLLRGDLQLRQGDTVYVLRDIPIPNSDRKHTYDTIGTIDYNELDIFRIERLWIDKETGKRLAYGHHYLRPHETYHEPTRKFFPNEVMRVPLYEAVPVELIIRHCWVLDVNTYRKGRPIGAPEDHLYICEYRVDKSARLFSKVSKNKFPCCTKSFAFEKFETPLKISRTYTPHDLDPILVKPRGRKAHDHEEPARETLDNATVAPPIVRTPGEQKARLNKILLSLLGKMPTKNVVDVSYLLEGSRRRKKQTDCVKSN